MGKFTIAWGTSPHGMRIGRVVHGCWTGRLPAVQNLPRIDRPRRVIAGENETPRGGFKVFTCWTRECSGVYCEGSVAYDVWARDVVEAAQVISPRINQVEVVEKCK